MSLRVDSFYEQNALATDCAICGRSTSTRQPVRFILMDGDESIGDVCERCAHGSTDLWRIALTEYAIRLQTKAAILRSLASRVDDAQPAPEGIKEELIRKNMNRRPGRPGGLPPFRR